VARRVAAAAAGGAAGGGADAFATPPVAALASVTLGLVVVSHDSPKTLASTLESYRAGGLLELLEDRVCVLSAALPEEIELCLRLGFRVYTPARAETRAAVARHAPVFARFEAAAVEAFPHTHMKNGRPATYVGPAALIGYLDMTVDVVIFAEKDWFLPSPPLVTPRLLARSLLASLAMLSGNTQVVRLRRGDDPNRDGLINVCAGEGADGNSNFAGGGCSWNSRYDWMRLFCDPDAERASSGQLRVCLDEAAASNGGGGGGGGGGGAAEAADEALRVFSFTLDRSCWSNNAALYRREWFLKAFDHTAILSEPGNGNFEMNAVTICDFCKRNGCGSGPDNKSPTAVAQLLPGLFVHKELDGFRR
jgi:hypothetical protein